ncbi:MAG: DUF6516 family protein [Burkholderiales bacterium]
MPSRFAAHDPTLGMLLDLHGTNIMIGARYWVKINAWLIEPDEARPHGIRYELSLHDAGNRRLLGFDNAHAVKRPGGRFIEQPLTYDHMHRGPKDAGVPYAYENAGKLVADFWRTVFKAMDELGEAT